MSRLYTIAAVSKLTGISCHALRVWERRYGFPVPDRSESGRRQYDKSQVDQLLAVCREIEQTESVSAAISALKNGRLAIDDSTEQDQDLPQGATDSALMVTDAEAWVDDLIRGDSLPARLWLNREILSEEAKLHAIELALIEVGERWFRGDCEIFQEHFASGFLRRQLAILYCGVQSRALPPERDDAEKSSTRKDLLLGAVQGEHHEGGLMATAIALEAAGWQTRLLGVDLPVAELHQAVKYWRPQVLALSFALSRNLQKRFGELGQIQEVPVFVGGRIILNHQSLARKHGLFPLAGNRREAIRLMSQEWDDWQRKKEKNDAESS